jgi:radical SAM superfamily enzyme YgiQ (UPF0313 family)
LRIDIVVVYVNRYSSGHEANFTPPITGIHLAALTPPGHDIRVVHQQTEPVDLDTDADLVALSFFSGFAHVAYRLADALRARGRKVVAGGPHVTFWAEEALAHVDAVVVGEAEGVWAQLVQDAERGQLQPRYEGAAGELAGLPTPRYDLLSKRFFNRRVLQATRGCPFSCSFCTVPSLNPGFRTRPVEEVLRDVAHVEPDWTWWQRKIAWFWDDNLLAPRRWAKDLLRGMVGMDRWWLTQASIDITRDDELLELMQASGCIGVFLGIESLDPASLKHANKRQNKVGEYERGIAVMAGFVAGFDHDTPESIVGMADALTAIGVDVPFLSVLTPFRGTALHEQFAGEERLLFEESGGTWAYYNGYNVTFQPRLLSPDDLLQAHRELWRQAFGARHVLRRMARGTRQLRGGALAMSAMMNAFYGYKALRGNEPADMRGLVQAVPRIKAMSA